MSRERQVQRGHHFAIVDEVDSILIDEARTPLIISGRVADAAQLYYKFASIVRGLRRDEDYEVDEQKRTVSPTEDGIEKVEQALGIENLYDGVAQNLVHQLQAALRGQGAVQAGQGLHHRRRRGEDRRRVHRPHPRGPALVRGPPPGRRGQGGREDQGGEPDPRHGHPPELLPHVRQARRDDRHRPHRGGRVRQHLRPPRRAGPHQPGQRPRSTRPTSSTRPRTASSTPSSTTSPSATPPASPSSSARSRWRSPRSSRGCSTSGASPTRCSTPSSTPVRPRSSPRPAASRPSPWPPTWPVEASTSSSAATPRACLRDLRAQGLDPDVARGRGRSYDLLLDAKYLARDPGRGRQDPRARRPLRARHRAPRVAPHRQPAARPLRPPGRPRGEPLLPLARGRPHAPVRHRAPSTG